MCRNVFFCIMYLFITSCSENRKPIVEVAGKSIYVDAVDATIESKLYYHLMEIYDDRLLALNKMIEWEILNAEAVKRGMTYEDFIDSLYRVEIYDDPVKNNQIAYIQDSTGRFDISYEQGKQIMIRTAKSELRKRWVDSLSVPYKVKINLKRPEKILRIDMNDVECYDKYGKALFLILIVPYVRSYNLYLSQLVKNTRKKLILHLCSIRVW